MISAATTARLDALYAAQGSYQPNGDIKAALRSKVMLMFIGATCEGKNTVMSAVSKLDPEFQIVGTFTSREPRDSDITPYTYYENTDKGLQPLLDRIDRREVVQYAVNPHAHLIYGSELSDYFSTYNLGDVFASAVSSFRQLGFQKALAITVITEPSVWLQRFDERFPHGHPQRIARRDEAIDSFTWSLSQATSDHFWVENIDGKPETAAAKAIEIARGISPGQPEARELAEASLKAAQSIAA